MCTPWRLITFIFLQFVSTETPENLTNIAGCTLVTPVAQGVALPPNQENCILRRLEIDIVNGLDESLHANFALYQRHGCHGRRLLYVQMLPGAWPPLDTPTTVYLEIKLKPEYDVFPPYVPIFYSIFSSDSTTVFTPVPGNPNLFYSANYTDSYYEIFFVIAELGYATSGQYAVAGVAPAVLTATLTSDVIANNPFVGVVTPYEGALNFVASPTLPSNRLMLLNRTRHALKRSAVPVCVPGEQLGRMSFAAFVNELRTFFRCDTPCVKTICCNTIFFDYVTFVTSCIKVIAKCEEPNTTPICLSPTGNNACWVVNEEICKCARGLFVGVCANVEIQTLFSEFCGSCEYVPMACGVYPVPPVAINGFCPVAVEVDVSVGVAVGEMIVPEESKCESSSEEERTKKKTRKPRKRQAKKAAPEKGSAVGWYVAGGVVVAVTVGVAVYVLIL